MGISTSGGKGQRPSGSIDTAKAPRSVPLRTECLSQAPPIGSGRTQSVGQAKGKERTDRELSGSSQGHSSGTGQTQRKPAAPSVPPALTPSTSSAGAAYLTRSPAGSSRSDNRTINLGIETEFYLAARGVDYEDNMYNFARGLAESYNANVPAQHPRMRPNIRPFDYKGGYDTWCLVCDLSMATPRPPCKPVLC